MAGIALGAFYNPHLARVILDTDGLSYLALADAPALHDPSWPQIKQRFTLLLHDYLGQLSEPLEPHELARAQGLLQDYRSPWAAEHLQRIRPTPSGPAAGANGHRRPALNYVFPPLYTEDFLDAYAANAAALQRHLGVPLALEPIPSYLPPTLPQMPETEFVSRLLERTSCQLLLDLPHLVLSARRLARLPQDFLAELPLERVIELHVAGLAWDADLDEDWMAPVPPSDDILDLAEQAVSRSPNLRAVTFDAYSPSLTADVFREAIHGLRARFG
jgi:uncharacterized protein (UPF0276 family)